MPNPVGTDRLETGAGGSVALRCACPKGWRASAPGRFGRAEHPGTAVQWGGELFEVVAAEPLPDGGIRYSLAPWRNDHAVRWLERYDAESEATRAAEREWRSSALRTRRLAMIFSPLLGHLPGPVQEELERESGAPANAMTVISAAPLFVVGILGCFAGIARMAGGSLAPFPEPSLPLSVYLVLES